MTRSELEAIGFKYCGMCNCDGTTNYKYTKGDYVFYMRYKRLNFHVKKGFHYLIKNEPFKKLNETIQNLFPEKVMVSDI